MKNAISKRKRAISTLRRGLQVLILLALLLSVATPAYAEGEPPGGTGAESQIIEMFKRLAQMFISISYALLFIIFAFGAVRSGLGANAAQQFGATGRVSIEFINFAGGIAVFIFGLMTLPIVNWVTNELIDLVPSNLEIFVPTF